MSQRVDDPRLNRANDALARRAWGESYDLLREADGQRPLGSDALPLLAQAAYMAGHPEVAREAWERIHGQAIRRGDQSAAAEAAIQLAYLLVDAGLIAQVRAWIGRAERLLETQAKSRLHGMVAVIRSTMSLITGHIDQALEFARHAVDVSTRFDDGTTLIAARISEARALIFLGHLEEGLSLLDECAVAAASGELDPVLASIVYCNVVCSWQGLAEYDRAEEWTQAMTKLLEQHPGGSVHGFCRVHRAEILRLRGACRKAEEEAQRAVEEIRSYSKSDQGWPLNELGTIRLRLGDLAGAEAAFLEAHELGWDPQPGLALVRAAQGNVSGAAQAIRDALESPMDAPSWELPPNTKLRRAPLLAAQAGIAAADGDTEVMRAAAEELDEIAGTFGSKALRATAETALGMALLADGDHPAARASFQKAVGLWREVNAPYETARARVELARAYRAEGNEDRAGMELQSARSTFERLGARLDARKAGEMIFELRPEGVASAREQKVFMFTDIVNSTSLVEAIGDEAWGHLVRWHNGKLGELVAEHGGEVVRTTGDGFFVAFDDATRAIGCAVAIQRALDEHRRRQGFSPQVRIGLHGSEATREGHDWSGVGVHAAARIGSLAQGDEILASRKTVDSTGQRFPVAGERSVALKGISAPVAVVAIEWR